MIVVFVHGWSVTDTETYGRLPEVLAARAAEFGLDLEIKHLWLGRYISFHDEVSVADVARAFDRALQEEVPGIKDGQKFSCITHSTGGPVVREWLQRFYGPSRLSQAPLRHLVMLAPANHGSPLAKLGKARIGRIKAWFGNVEPGQRILDWLSLGSQQQIELAREFLDYKLADSGFYPFVLTGQSIDKKLYDFVNKYLVEKGSDGVVRVAGANLNYSMLRLVETAGCEEEQDSTHEVKHGSEEKRVRWLGLDGSVQRPERVPLGVIPGASHSGKSKGIMRSIVSQKSGNKPQVEEILKCLLVKSEADYRARDTELNQLSAKTQQNTHRYTNLVFVVKDDQGDPVTDYDLFLLGGEGYDPDRLSKGFFVDRQQNSAHPNHLVYYVDYDVITKNQLTGFRVIGQPTDGFAFYHAVEFRMDAGMLATVLRPNETLYVEIVLRRCVDRNTFRFDSAEDPKLHRELLPLPHDTRRDFKHEEPSRREKG